MFQLTTDHKSAPRPTSRQPRLQTPQLLVSVRNAAEAALAIQGGCQILDVKEPHRGSLGMAAPQTLAEIADHVQHHSPSITLTAALGEVHEYRAYDVPHLPQHLNLVKLGCARLGGDPDWRRTWRTAREGYSQRLTSATGWVAVVYADHLQAESPPARDIVHEAIDSGCRGVLVDTFAKSSGRLLDWCSTYELIQMADEVHRAGMFLALAGSLRLTDLPRLTTIPADIIAIRGAACPAGHRTNPIDQSAVQNFRTKLDQAWSKTTLPNTP